MRQRVFIEDTIGGEENSLSFEFSCCNFWIKFEAGVMGTIFVS